MSFICLSYYSQRLSTIETTDFLVQVDKVGFKNACYVSLILVPLRPPRSTKIKPSRSEIFVWSCCVQVVSDLSGNGCANDGNPFLKFQKVREVGLVLVDLNTI